MGKGGKKKRARRVIKTAKGVFSNFDDEAYRKLEASKKDAFQTYIRSNRLNVSTNGLSLHRPDDGGLPIIYIDVTLQMDKKLGMEVTKICPPDKGLNLHHRSSEGLGLLPDESFEVRWSDGTLIAIMQRNVFTPDEAKASDIFQRHHEQHSLGWNRGCQADGLPRKDEIAHQLTQEKMMKSTGVNAGSTINEVKSGGKGNTNTTRLYYKHPSKPPTSVTFGTFIDRMTWISKTMKKDGRSVSYDEFLDNCELSALVYWKKLRATYIELCSKFIKKSVSETESILDGTIKLNSNIFDDKESRLHIHHDMPCLAPALATGSSNYQYQDGRWIPKHRGGRLFLAEGVFWLDYRPTDIVVFCGCIPHGTSLMKPLNKTCGDQSFKRFSMILFSTYGRGNMRSHGYFRNK